MRHNQEPLQLIELTEELPQKGSVAFNTLTASLKGIYGDELSAHRAKKVWISILESTFLLDLNHDFVVKVNKVDNESYTGYALNCDFNTACGRYALWRLTHHQAPEAQYAIETGHIPFAQSRAEDLISAPDLKPESLLHLEQAIKDSHRSVKLINKVTQRIREMFKQ